jgi:fibronectin-binding autotransporter adhesin
MNSYIRPSILGLLLLPSLAIGQTRTWIVSGGSWETPVNWSGNAVPTAANNVEILEGHATLGSGVSGAANAVTISGTDASLNITGGSLSSSSAQLGSATGFGQVLMTSGTWNNSGLFSMGTPAGGGGIVTLNGSTLFSGSGAVIRQGAITLTGANAASFSTWDNNGQDLYVGYEGLGGISLAWGVLKSGDAYLGNGSYSGTSGVNILEGTWNSSGVITVGNAGNGLLKIYEGTVTSSSIRIAEQAGSNGSVVLVQDDFLNNAPALIETGQISEGAGNGTLILQSGTLRATGNQADFLSGFEAGDIQLEGTNLDTPVIDTNGFQIGINTTMSGTGWLRKGGAGTLTISGSQAYTGVTFVDSGTLEIAAGGVIDQSSGIVVGSGTKAASLLVSGGSVAGQVVLGLGTSLMTGGTMNTMSFGLGGGSFTQSAGLITASQTVNIGSSGTFQVNGGTLNAGNSPVFVVGYASGTSTLNITAGLVTTGTTLVGFAGGSGRVTMSGGTWNADDLYVGYGDNGSLSISGGQLFSGTSLIGVSSVSTASVTGGGWTSTNGLYVGYSGTGTLTVGGSGTVSTDSLVLGEYTANSVGTLNLGTGAAGGVIQTALVTTGTGSGVISFNGGTLRATASQANYLAGFDPGDVMIGTGGAFLDSGVFSIGIGTTLSGAGGLTKLGVGTLTLSNANTYSGTTVIQSGTLALSGTGSISDSAEVNVAAGSVFHLAGLSGAGATIKNLSGSGGVALGTKTLTLGTADTTTFAGTISGTSSSWIIKQGSGTLALTGSQAYSGSTTVKNGTLALDGGSIAQGFGTVTVGGTAGDDGTLQILNGGHVASGVSYIGRGVGAVGSATVNSGTWSNSNDFSVGYSGTGNLLLNGGLMTAASVFVGHDASALGSVTVTSGTWLNQGMVVGYFGKGDFLINGGVVRSPFFSTVGHGSSATGTATVSSGTWEANDLIVGRDGSGTLLVQGGLVSGMSLRLGSASAGVGLATVTGGTLSGDGGLVVGVDGAGSLFIDGGLVSYASSSLGSGSGKGAVTMTSGTWVTTNLLQIAGSGSASLTIDGGYVSSGSAVLASGVGSQATVTVNSGTWTNAGALTFNTGGASLLLSGGLVSSSTTHMVAGLLTLQGGALQTGQLFGSPGSKSMVLNGGTLRATGNQGDFISGFDAGEVTIGSGGAIVDSNGFAIGISTALSGTGGFTKVGAGSLSLSGTNSYAGATTVSSGTLAINGIHSGSGDVTVQSGATLSGTGTIGGAVTVQNGGTLATGNSIGILTVAGASFESGSLFSLEGDGAFFDSLVVGGNVTLQAGALIAFDLLNPLTQTSYTLITAAGGLDGSTQFSLSGSMPAGYMLQYSGTTLSLVYVPAEIGTITVTPTDTTIITGGTTSVVVTVGNDTPSGGADLDATVAGDGTNVSGTSTVVVAPQTTGTASPDLAFSSTTVGVQTGTVTVTDPNATNSPQSGTMTVTVMGHADPLVSGTTFNLGYVHEGYAAPVVSDTQLVTNGTAGAFIVDLKADEVTDGSLSINGISGVVAGDSANVAATLATGQGVGVISGTYTYVFGDDSNLPGASDNIGSTTFAVTGEVYSGQGVWITSGSGSWGTLSSGFGENWQAGGGSPGLDAAFASTDTATFGAAGSGIVTLDGASPSLKAVTFDNASEIYTLLQGSGGTLTLNGGTNAAVIENLAGSHFIDAPINLATNTLFTVANAMDILTIGGTIGGSGNVEVGGAGRTIFTQNQSYAGTTTVTSGALTTESLTGGAVNLEGGLFSPGDAGAVSQITVSTLNLNGGGLEFDLAAPGSSDAILVTGTTTMNAATQFTFLDAGFSEGIFALVQGGTLVNFGDLSGLTFTSDIAGLQGIFGIDGNTLFFRGFTADTIFTGPVLSNYAPYLIPTTARFLVDGPVTTWPENLSNTIDSLIFKNGSSLSVFNDLTVTSGNFTVRRGSASIDGGRVVVPGDFNLIGRGTFIAGSEFAIGGDANINGGNLVINNLFNAGGNMNVYSTVTVNGNAQIGGNLNTDASEIIVNRIFGIGGEANINNASSLLVNQGGAMNVARATNIHAGSTAQINGVVTSPQVNNSGLLKGTGVIVGNLWNNGIVAPGNSPGTLTVNGNYVQTANGTLQIELGDLLLVSGNASLAGRLQLVAAGKLKYGQQIVFLQAGSISGEFDEIVVPNPSENRGRVLTEGGTGTLLIAPTSYTLVAETTNQRNVAKALDGFIPEKANDRETVSIALDLQSAEQYPAAFDQIAPTYHETVANITLEQAFVQSQQLNQRFSAVRLGARGFQAIGIESPLVHDKDGKSVFDAKDAKQHIPQSEIPNPNWSLWAMGNGLFGRMTGIGQLPNQNFNSGGFLVGADYTLGGDTVVSVDGRQRSAVPALAVGLYGGYQYTWADAGDTGNTQINSALFGGYASYTQGGFYADGIVGGGYNGYRVRRGIRFSTIDRTARSQPNGGQFNASLNLGYDWELGKFTLGPIAGVQYAYAGIAPFSETGADSLDLRVGQQNVNSLRTTFGGRIAYTWNVTDRIAIIPEVRMFWQHEFLNNPRNISSALDGGSGPTFGYETSAPARDSVFAGAGVSAQFGERWNAFFYWNVDFGRQDYFGNSISGGLNWKF